MLKKFLISVFLIEIILIKRSPTGPSDSQDKPEDENLIKFIPDSDDTIRPGDSFIVLGESEKIKQFKYI